MHSKYKEIIYDFYKSSCKDFKNQKIGFELESFVLDKKTRIQTNMDELYHIYKDLKK